VFAIKGLTQICEELPEHASKVVYLVGQMFNTDNATEAEQVQRSLTRLLQLDVKGLALAYSQCVLRPSPIFGAN